MHKKLEMIAVSAAAILPMGLVVAVGLAGVWALMAAPSMGIKLSFSGEEIRVTSVAEYGPAAGQIAPGEYLRAIGRVRLEKEDILRYPEFVRRIDERNWWQRQQAIYEELKASHLIELAVASPGEAERRVQVKTVKWPLGSILARGFPIFLSGVVLGAMSAIMRRRSRSPLHRVSSFFFFSLGMYHMASAPMTMREIAVGFPWGQGFAYTAYLAAGGCISLVHFAMIFPRRKTWLAAHPRLVWVLYGYFGLTAVLYLTGITAFGTTYLCLLFWVGLMVVATLHAYWTERDLLLKQQVLLFLMIPVLIAMFLCVYIILPSVLRTNAFEYSYFAILTVASVFSMALAVENLRIYQEALEKEQVDLRDRTRLVREVHDNFGNVLSGIIRMADDLTSTGPEPKEGRGALGGIRAAAQSSLFELRSFIEAVNPSSTLWEDFTATMRRHAVNYLHPLHIRLDFDATVDPEMEFVRPLVRHHLTGIIREALGNVVKHANARRVNMRLTLHKGRGQLVIQDDGEGFEVPRSMEGAHGLVHMEQRARELDGALTILAAEKGTRLEIDFAP